MNRDELVERVAEAIYAGMFGPHTRWEDDTARQHDRMRKLARAALAIIELTVREECAQILDTMVCDLNSGKLMQAPTKYPDTVRGAFAAAIRAGAKP